MSLPDTYQKKGGFARAWRLGVLAGLGLLAGALGANAQVTVDTIGGGVRTDCGSASGFAGGNTYEDAQFDSPYACALDTNGNLWIADTGNNDIEQISQAGNKTSSLTAEIYATSGSSPHVVTNFHYFTNVNAVAVDPANNLYVLLPTIPMVVKASLAAETTSLNELSYLVLTNTPTHLKASALAVDANSNVFVAFTNGVIIRFQMLDHSPAPTVYSNNYVLGASAAVHYVVTNFHWNPAGIAIQANGNLAVSDLTSNAIYVVSTNDYNNPANTGPHLVTGGNGAGFDDGAAEFAQFDHPLGIAATADGRLIVCDSANNRLRLIDSRTNTTTLYGTSSNVWPATCCDCDPALYAGWVDGAAGQTSNSAAGRTPASVVIAPSGTLFVTELYYDLIREVVNTNFTPVNLLATLPTAVTLPATAVTNTNATFNGTVNAGDTTSYYYFEWGTNTGYGNFTTTNAITTNTTTALPVSAIVGNLLPGTTYHYQLVATNGLGASYGGDVTVVTSDEGPVVTTQPATAVGMTNATLNATVNPEYSPTTVNFQWGTTTNYGFASTPITLSNNLTGTQSVSNTITNLQAGTLYYFQAVAYNSGGVSYGSQLIFQTLTEPPPMISISPSNGYYPECVAVTVTSSVSTIYYTTNGTPPTTNSVALVMTNMSGTNYTGTIEWCNSQKDLSYLELLGYNGTNSTVVQGSLPSTNQIGFPQPLLGGTGGHLYIPVVADLQSGVGLKSLQFVVEVTPMQSNTPMIPAINLQPLTANDYVPLPGPAPSDGAVTFETTSYTNASGSQFLSVFASGSGSGLDMQSSGVVTLLRIEIPTNAGYGQSYALSVFDPSGTSDGEEDSVGLVSLPAQTLTISDPDYMVGDGAPSQGYNAGQFGNGYLDNSDVNNVIYASVGIRVPPSDSDAYNAMDSWPPDSAGRGGDGFIRLLDWETTLGRSLGGVPIFPGLDTNNYIRFWTNGDTGYPSHEVVDWGPGGTPVPLALPPEEPKASKLATSNTPPGLVWYCNAAFRSGTITNATPGVTYYLPVSVSVLSGYSLDAMQFRATVTGSAGAPEVSAIQFNPASGMLPPSIVLPGLGVNDMVYAWYSMPNALVNSNYLGTISFEVPASAAPGSSYAMHFSGVDGAPDSSTEYELESFPGYVWVESAATQPASITSDEWKIAFFGSTSNALAADNVDADGDGALNWEEYLAGTNPTNALSCLKFSSATYYTNGVTGVAINWLTAPGKGYILRTSASLTGAAWTPINTNSGDGNEYQIIVTNSSAATGFYQILLQP